MDQQLETDYLIIGAGAVGMAVADVLFTETDASIVIVDRRSGPGGHWNDAYPFVRLHQPSANYGVESRPLGDELRRDASPLNRGSLERATSAEIVAYYERFLADLVASGRVRFLPVHDHTGEVDGRHRVEPLLGGASVAVRVRRKVVDATYMCTSVPATHTPSFTVAPGVRCIPPNGLARVSAPPEGYVVIGGGKTGVDTCLFLLEGGVPAEAIRWIVPRDSWFQNRAGMQPVGELAIGALAAQTVQAEIAATAATVDELFERMEDAGQLLRLDPAVTPGMFHGAIVSEAELELLRTITDVVRLGRVRRIEAARIVLDEGDIASSAGCLYIDCSAIGAPRVPTKPIFAGRTITPQMVRMLQPVFSAALIAHIEATVDDEEEKNALCRPIPMSDDPADWIPMTLMNLANQRAWRSDPRVGDWLMTSRLDRFSRLTRDIAPDDDASLELLRRYRAAIPAAVANLRALAATAVLTAA
jgi:hypothetical protein